jgi:HEAT repeat protein
MALFGLFGKKDDPSEIKKLQTKATAKFGQKEGRQDALTRLNDIKSADALAAMLQRFTVRVEPGIVDDEEKEYVYECLVAAGEIAVAPIKSFIEKQEHPTWALKALEQLVPKSEMVETILTTLEKEGAEYTRDPEKKITLLRHLEQLDDERIGPRVVPFLEDMSEDVVIEAVTVLAARKHESAREPLIQTLLKANANSSQRLKRAAADALAKAAFSVKGQTPAVQAALPSGFSIDKDGHVRSK